jgi:valyl-tRNA synthetase
VNSLNSISKSFDPKLSEEKLYNQWEKAGYFTVKSDDPRPAFSIVMPPPNVTGALHMGHALDVTLQDILIRYKRMSGFCAMWLPGTDHAGIATQNVVERHLEQNGTSREKIGREAFLSEVWKWKVKYGNEILNQIRKLGASCDWSRERFTLDEGLSTAVRAAFVRLYKEKLIYQSEYLVNWDPKNKTAVSDLEVEFKEVQGQLTYFKYEIIGGGEITVATTRPETMLGDTGIAVHHDDSRYKNVIGKFAKHPFVDRKIPIIADATVKKEFGTGAVKLTPAHDPTDYEMGKRHKLEFITVLDFDGKMNSAAAEFAGQDRYIARKKVIEALKNKNLLVKQDIHTHVVGHSQRSGAVIEPMISTQWFVSTKPLAEKAIQAVTSGNTQFVPENWTKTYLIWMEEIRDWCISRQLWWGHRIPVWYCDECETKMVEMTDPTECSSCNSKKIHQDPDVLDTWFSSGLWPFSTFGWPQQTNELKKFYPTSVLVTGFDIIFFWVARMMMMGTKFMVKAPFEKIHIHALVRDEDGQKMSKSKGNVINPLTIIDKYGTDAFRFTIAALSVQGRDILLSEKRIEGYGNFVNKLWNASRFVLASIPQDFKYDTKNINSNLVANEWILTQLNKTIETTRKCLDEMKFNEAADTLYQFSWHEFCDWYLEFSKLPISSNNVQDKIETLTTLVYVLENILKLLHPIMPFVTEEIWQKLPMTKTTSSIMVSTFPETFKIKINSKTSENIRILKGVITTIRAIRSQNQIPPSAKLSIHAWGDKKATTELQNFEQQLKKLCSIESVQYSIMTDRKNSAYGVFENVEIGFSLEGLVNKGAEVDRLSKEISKARQDMEFLQKRLADESYLQKAPSQLIQKDQDKLNMAKEKLSKLEKSKTDLQR